MANSSGKPPARRRVITSTVPVQDPSGVRLHELAREFGASTERVREVCAELGIQKFNSSSRLNEQEVELIRIFFDDSSLDKSRERRWAEYVDYDDCLMNEAPGCFIHEALDGIELEQHGWGRIHSSGGFAVIAKATLNGRSWALRLPTKERPEASDRYRAIAEASHGRLTGLLPEVSFLDDAIYLKRLERSFPAILVAWLPGRPLSEALMDPTVRASRSRLTTLRSKLRTLSRTLRDAQVAHGDISGENILVNATPKSLALHLVDFDSIWMPEIASLPAPAIDSEMLHPETPRGAAVGPSADVFAFKALDVAITTLIEFPDLDFGRESFEKQALATREQITTCTGPYAPVMRQADPDGYEELLNLLATPYEAISQRDR